MKKLYEEKINNAKLRMCFVLVGFMIFYVFNNRLYSQTGAIVINEFLASNASINVDPDFYLYSDWIELYNTSDQDIIIGGYYLTDNMDTLKWQIPAGILVRSKEYIVFWADGKDVVLNGCHTNFKLQKSGEEIGLYNTQGALVDSVTYTSQMCDISYGRQPDGASSWFFFDVPTPNQNNNSVLFIQAEAPEFSLKSGFYTAPQVLVLYQSSSSAVIRYTLNGDEPTESSPIYTTPLSIESRAGDQNVFSLIRTNRDPFNWLPDWVPPSGEVFKGTVIRARTFEVGKNPSRIITKTYFVDENIHQRYATIAVVSVVADSRHLFNDATGIYVPGNTHQPGNSESGNYFQEWEKPVHIEFFESGGESGFAQDIGIRIQGGTSPASPQKGLHIIARSKYGKNRIEYPIFRNNRSKAKNLTEFKRFIIRAWGSTILSAMFNDAFAHRIFAKSDLDIQAYRPAIVFINGEYWGLHEIREANKNSYYYQYHYGIDRENPGVDILVHDEDNGNPVAVVDEGDAEHWNNMAEFLNTHDMSISENYEYIKTQMDIENFILYIGHCIYVGKWDWPENNEASWRPKTADGRWKWIQYDIETGFGIVQALGPQYVNFGAEINMIKLVTEGLSIPDFGFSGPHWLLMRLLVNDEFKQSFVAWFDEHLETTLSPDTLYVLMDEMKDEIEPYMEEYRERWPFVSQMNNDWYYNIELMKEFIEERSSYLNQHLLEYFDNNYQFIVPGQYTLSQNYPNPFNLRTTFHFYLPRSAEVTAKIYNTNGKLVRFLVHGKLWDYGVHTMTWDGTDDQGREVSSGTFLLQVNAEGNKAVKKMILLR